jgi:hypothetical protein
VTYERLRIKPQVRNRSVTGKRVHVYASRRSCSRKIWAGLLARGAPAPNHNPGEPVITFEAVPVDRLERRVAARFTEDNAEIARAAWARAEENTGHDRESVT